MDRFVVIDVGCRGGPSAEWLAKLPNLYVLGFDVDRAVCKSCTETWNNFDFLSYGLGASEGKATFHTTAYIDCGSFLPPLPEAKITDPSFTETGQIEFEVRKLDSFRSKYFPDGADFLKVDTQGTELEVLKGAEETLQSVLIVQCEVEFNPFYAGQPLFGDVDDFLRKRGFEFFDFQCLTRYRDGGHHPYGQLNWADAFWFAKSIKNSDKLKTLARAVGFAHYGE